MLYTVTEEYSYTYDGGKLTQQTLTTTTETDTATTTTTETLYLTYDASGNPVSLTYTDASGAASTYYYAMDVQGDVDRLIREEDGCFPVLIMIYAEGV